MTTIELKNEVMPDFSNIELLLGCMYSMSGILTIPINFVNVIDRESINHADGSVSQSRKFVLVSENGHGWYRYYSKSDKIYKMN